MISNSLKISSIFIATLRVPLSVANICFCFNLIPDRVWGKNTNLLGVFSKVTQEALQLFNSLSQSRRYLFKVNKSE